MVDDILAARDYAFEKHGDQKYGDLPYRTHLYSVIQVLRDFGYDTPDFMKAGWLHDVIEDTDATVEEIVNRFGMETANLVFAVSGEGSNRKERNASIYRKIGLHPRAAILKVADRTANVEHSSPGSKHRLMYAAENPEFIGKIGLYVPIRMVIRLETALNEGL